jgi:DNA invertase Pin-like site-specific DNA recombinase
VSTKDQNCALQVRDLKTYCAARKFAIFREYIDVDESGAKNSRPELNNLMADARKRKFDSVVVWRFDRFARSTKHLLLALEEFRSLGIQFISYQENIDTTSPLGQALFHNRFGARSTRTRSDPGARQCRDSPCSRLWKTARPTAPDLRP